jgi:hypothetical protein
MAKNINPRRTWKYSEEFKVSAVEMSYLDGIKSNDVAEKLDIPPICCLVGEKNIEREKLWSINEKN